MANKDSTEISLMKGVSVKLNDDTMFTLGYFAHTEDHARDKSEYIYVGRIDKISDVQAEITELNSDEKKLQKWTWKGLPNYESIVYDKSDTNSRGSRWLNMRLKKLVDWDMFVKILDGWKEAKKAYNENAKYISDNYVADNGTVLANLKESREGLLNLVGHSVVHKCSLKSQLL